MEYVVKVVFYFLLWTLYSYVIHILAHMNFKFNFLKKNHLKHHSYKYTGNFVPPLADYFFWFGCWKSTLDVWVTFTIPLIILTFFEFEVGMTLLVFHYVYEVFLSRDVLDHNENIKGRVTNWLAIGSYHLAHHRNPKCNYSLFITLWDHLFRTAEENIKEKQSRMRGG